MGGERLDPLRLQPPGAALIERVDIGSPLKLEIRISNIEYRNNDQILKIQMIKTDSSVVQKRLEH